MKKLALIVLLTLTGCAGLQVEWAAQATYSTAHAKAEKAAK